MFSAEYLTALSDRVGFPADGLQKQMTLLDLLREVSRHPVLGRQFALKGGTAINLFWFPLPRLSVDIDLNYVGSPDREVMRRDRPELETELRKLIQSRGISVEHAPEDHAGAKWRLRSPSSFGGRFTLEVDLNYLMRVPVWGVNSLRPFPLDEDYVFDCNTVSFEELFAGKIKALLDRSAPRDLYDVFKLSKSQFRYDASRLRKAIILFGLTCEEDWRKKDFRTFQRIDQAEVESHLVPLLRSGEHVDVEEMKAAAADLLSTLLVYEAGERSFMDHFLDDGIYEPGLIFSDPIQAARLTRHPAVLWKLLNHRKFLKLENSEGADEASN